MRPPCWQICAFAGSTFAPEPGTAAKPPVHAAASKLSHVLAQASVPGASPTSVHEVAVSQTSAPSRTPLPQVPQPLVSIMHVEEQASEPLSKPPPIDVQVAPLRLVPSHCSPASRMPLPQPSHALVSNVHVDEHPSVPLTNPSPTQVW